MNLRFLRNSSPTSHRSAGFTLLELLISSVLLAIIFVSVSSMLITSLSAATRTKLWQEARAEGTFAMTQTIFLIRNSVGVLENTCLGALTNDIVFDNADDTKSKIEVDVISNRLKLTTIGDSETNWSTATDVTWLTSNSVTVSNPEFTCSQTGEQPYILIRFDVTRTSHSAPPITHTFSRAVILRNI